jgi:hypothetical protein
MKKAATAKAPAVTAEKIAETSALTTYTRSDGATMVEIAPYCYVSAECLALSSGRTRATSER